jgi:hypothetical protein
MRSGAALADALAPRVARSVLLAGFLTIPSACSGSEADNGQHPGSGDEGCEGRGEEIVRGMKKASDDGTLEVTLLSATPLPPLQDENTWTMGVVRDGEPVLDEGNEDSQVVANVYMAEHDHNTRTVGAMTEPGVFDLGPFLITMNGYWEITVQVRADADADDREDAVFGFCIRN